MLERYSVDEIREEVEEILYDRHGQVCSLHDRGESIVETISGEEDFPLTEAELPQVVQEVEELTGRRFERAQVADDNRYLRYHAV